MYFIYIYIISAPAEAFEVPLCENNESLIKKHPPKRVLQRLAEPSSNASTVNLKDVEEKLANAEIRRNKVGFFHIIIFFKFKYNNKYYY